MEDGVPVVVQHGQTYLEAARETWKPAIQTAQAYRIDEFKDRVLANIARW
jgi:hypothetical protein